MPNANQGYGAIRDNVESERSRWPPNPLVARAQHGAQKQCRSDWSSRYYQRAPWKGMAHDAQKMRDVVCNDSLGRRLVRPTLRHPTTLIGHLAVR